MTGKWKLFVRIFSIFLVLLAIHPSALAEESFEGSVQKRRIAIVLDNSDSMIIDSSSPPYLPRWAEATHALRTFLYMVESTDEVKLFSVAASSDRDTSSETNQKIATVSDENIDKDNIDATLHKVGISHQTRMYGMEAARNWLNETDDTANKWMVVLSDGEFYDYDESDALKPLPYSQSVGEHAKKNSRAGIHTIFVGLDIADNALGELCENANLSVFNTSNGKGIEETILGISREIYHMSEIDFSAEEIKGSPEFSYASDKSGFTWKTEPGLDAYLKRIIIIAQTGISGASISNETYAPDSQVIQSDDHFSWCAPEDLVSVLRNHDLLATSTFKFGDPRAFQQEIEKTLLKKTCYIRSYSENEIGESIEFQVPAGDYTYRIYYELKNDIVPDLYLKQDNKEMRPDTAGNLYIAEGPVDIGYRLISDKKEIPQTLGAICDAVEAVYLDDVPVSGAVKFSYSDDDSESNHHSLCVSFNGETSSASIEVEPNIVGSAFLISGGQEINIDYPDKNYITIETTLPPNWLKEQLPEKLEVSFEDDIDHGITFKLDSLRIEQRMGKTRLLIPVAFEETQLDLTETVPIKATMYGHAKTSYQVASGSLTVTQEIPTVVMHEASEMPDIIQRSGEKILLHMCACVGEKDVTDQTRLAEVSVTGLDSLANIPFQYDEEGKNLTYDGSLLDSFSLLLSGKTSGMVNISGRVFRNDILVDDSWTGTCAVSWTGSLRTILIFGLIILLLTLGFITLIVLTVNGKLMLSEIIGWRIFHSIKTLPLEWLRIDKPPYPVILGKNFRSRPFTLRLSINAITPDCPADSWIDLIGTKGGFRMTEQTEDRLSSKGIKFVSDSLELKNIGDALEFHHSSSGHSSLDIFQLRYCTKRKKWPAILVLLILYILAILAAIGIYR